MKRKLTARGLSRSEIKYIAMLTMLCNHIAHIFLTEGTVSFLLMESIGYFTAITMCYFLVEGYGYTHSRKRYALRLFLFAVLSELPYCLAFTKDGILSFYGLNMLFTLLLCFGMLWAMQRVTQPVARAVVLIVIVYASVFCDWAVMAPLFTAIFAQVQSKKELPRAYAMCILIFLLFQMYIGQRNLLEILVNSCGLMLSGVCIIGFYHGKQSYSRKTGKWFFYVFYPVHLLILGLIRLLCMQYNI